MARPAIIGFHGRARSGKDTAADFLIAKIGGYRYSFADPIRRMLLYGFGINMSDPYWIANKETVIPALGKSPRQLMQTLGTEWGRDLVHPNVWLTLAQQRLVSDGPGMIISDVRFENEASWIRNLGGAIVHIQRRGTAPVQAHVSEAGVQVLPQDFVVSNNGTLEELQASVEGLFGVD